LDSNGGELQLDTGGRKVANLKVMLQRESREMELEEDETELRKLDEQRRVPRR
jgi:hypothetical protein